MEDVSINANVPLYKVELVAVEKVYIEVLERVLSVAEKLANHLEHNRSNKAESLTLSNDLVAAVNAARAHRGTP
jgi:hypothetical protein